MRDGHCVNRNGGTRRGGWIHTLGRQYIATFVYLAVEVLTRCWYVTSSLFELLLPATEQLQRQLYLLSGCLLATVLPL